MALGAAAMFTLSILCAALRAFRVWLEERAQSFALSLIQYVIKSTNSLLTYNLYMSY